MSYLNIPRLHFAGKFQADPSTVNNNDNNWDPRTTLSNDRNAPGWVYWNPNGTHNWKLVECAVRGAANDKGQFTAPSSDPIIGAQVLSAGNYPAKLVDLDPDNQGLSQIWGLHVQVSIADPTDRTKVLASVAGKMPPTAFGDLWNRAANAPRPGMPTMSASFQAVLEEVTWVNASASPILAALQKISPTSLSIRFTVDSYQPNSNERNFTYGRVVGTIGPVFSSDAPRSTSRRLAPVFAGPPSIMSSFGPAGAAWDAKRNVLILDLGNCMPTNGVPPASGPSVPENGWPVIASTLQLTIGGASASSAIRLKSGADFLAGRTAATLPTFSFDTSTYLNYAGIVEIPVPPDQVPQLLASPLTLTNVSVSPPVIAVQEEPEGRYVDVDVPFFRLNPGDSGQVTLWATKFGQPWKGASLSLALDGVTPAGNGGPWNNSDPQNALALSSNTATTDATGAAKVTLAASDPGTPRMYPDGNPGPDGQVYWVTGPWAAWGQIFLFSGAPINVLLFSAYPMPPQPNWDEHVGPILSNYARMYPYMKGIMDIGDYATVVQNASAIGKVLNLPQSNPHHMPIVRDLSRDKLAMINHWLANGMPKSASPPIV